MTGPEHYREAEKCLAAMNGKGKDAVAVLVGQAQVHATLALAAAAVTQSADLDRWYEVVLPDYTPTPPKRLPHPGRPS